jgi:hypothetical protein
MLLLEDTIRYKGREHNELAVLLVALATTAKNKSKTKNIEQYTAPTCRCDGTRQNMKYEI